MWETLFFWFFAIGAVLSSLAVVLIPRNPLYSALALIVDFFFFAGLYVLLSAHFLAVVQVLVYGGAIMVLFVFIIMLLNIRESEHQPIKINVHQVVGVFAGIGLLTLLVSAFQPLLNEEAIEVNRDVYQSKVETMSGDEKVVLQTESPIPGLTVDLNEAGVNERYRATMTAYAEGRIRPADGQLYSNFSRFIPKYREFDRTQNVEIPQELLPVNDSDYGQRKPSEFGTVQPLSVLLVNRFVIPFELTAILLLAAVVGAFIVAKKRL